MKKGFIAIGIINAIVLFFLLAGYKDIDFDFGIILFIEMAYILILIVQVVFYEKKKGLFLSLIALLGLLSIFPVLTYNVNRKVGILGNDLFYIICGSLGLAYQTALSIILYIRNRKENSNPEKTTEFVTILSSLPVFSFLILHTSATSILNAIYTKEFRASSVIYIVIGIFCLYRIVSEYIIVYKYNLISKKRNILNIALALMAIIIFALVVVIGHSKNIKFYSSSVIIAIAVIPLMFQISLKSREVAAKRTFDFDFNEMFNDLSGENQNYENNLIDYDDENIIDYEDENIIDVEIEEEQIS